MSLGAALLTVLFALVLLGPSARGAEHVHEGVVGAFYEKWMSMPSDRKASCCNQEDCYPTEVRAVADGWEFWDRDEQKWRAIPQDRLESNAKDPLDSPDGRSHVCVYKTTGTVLCAVLGSGQ